MYYLWPSLSVWARVMLTSVQEDVVLLSDEERQFSSVQVLSCAQLFATPWTAARQATLSITGS